MNFISIQSCSENSFEDISKRLGALFCCPFARLPVKNKTRHFPFLRAQPAQLAQRVNLKL
jgi:hypothetical protein